MRSSMRCSPRGCQVRYGGLRFGAPSTAQAGPCWSARAVQPRSPAGPAEEKPRAGVDIGPGLGVHCSWDIHMARQDNSFTATTRQIRVTVRAFYLADQSEPDRAHFVWAYRVTIENKGGDTVQLL